LSYRVGSAASDKRHEERAAVIARIGSLLATADVVIRVPDTVFVDMFMSMIAAMKKMHLG
jgi:hypothetical protein